MILSDIKLVACDMDGTLFSANSQITLPVQRAIQQLSSHDIIFSITSGRMPHRINEHINSFIPTHKQYYVANNGATVIYGGILIYNQTFPVKPYRDLILKYLNLGLEIDFDFDDTYRPLICTPRTIKHANDIHGYDNPLGIGNEVWELEVNKISVMDPIDSGILNNFIQNMLEIGGCTPYQYGIHAAEIAPINCSKLSGIQLLASLLGINMQNVLAIGDHTNDIAMLTKSGASAAVGNAVTEVKACAKYCCKGEYGDGVLEAFQHYLPFDI